MKIISQETSSHWYTDKGESAYNATLREARKQNLLPSVTTIMKAWPAPQLEIWKQEQIVLAALTMPEQERAKHKDVNELAKAIIESSKEEGIRAADFGTRMHDYIDFWITDRCESRIVDKPMVPYLECFAKWYDENVAELVMAESVVTDLKRGYAGRIDAVVKLKNGNKALWDIKCRSVKNGKPALYDSMIMQLAAYNLCLAQQEVWVNEYISITINRDKPEPPYIYSWSPRELLVGIDNWELCRQLWKATLGRGYAYDPAFKLEPEP